MLLRTIYDERLAQASYFVGCQQTGTAIVIDPARDITPYLQIAQEEGFSIVGVAETHIHADFVSGSRELAEITGAVIYLSGEGDETWQYAFPSTDDVKLVHEGDRLTIGNVWLDVIHTPGHTPEHIAFLLTDSKVTQAPMAIFTGDCLFVGDAGRPDLLEKVANTPESAIVGARLQFRNIQRLAQLPDYLQVLPGHGAGSACGKALGAVPSSTLGYEKIVNPAFNQPDEDTFAAWLLADQPEPPHYFAQMKAINRAGAALLKELPQPQHISEMPDTDIVPPDALFIDTRPAGDYSRHHLPNTINIPINSRSFSTYVGWFVDYDAPTFFIAYLNDVQEVLRALFAIGVDDVRGYFTAEVVASAPLTLPQITVEEVYDRGMPILDVRGLDEYRDEHIPGAVHIHMGAIMGVIADLPRDRSFAVQCGTGVRSQIVTSLLQSLGFDNVWNMTGGLNAWKKAGFPTEQG
jgi:hydroxyacylglutathione hydrolase